MFVIVVSASALSFVSERFYLAIRPALFRKTAGGLAQGSFPVILFILVPIIIVLGMFVGCNTCFQLPSSYSVFVQVVGVYLLDA